MLILIELISQIEENLYLKGEFPRLAEGMISGAEVSSSKVLRKGGTNCDGKKDWKCSLGDPRWPSTPRWVRADVPTGPDTCGENELFSWV